MNSNKYDSAKDKIRNLIEMEIGSRWQSGKVLAPEQYGDGGTAWSWDPACSEDQDGDDQDQDHNQAQVNHYDDHDDGADQDYDDDDPHTTDMVGRPGYEIPTSAQKIGMMMGW